MIEKEVPVDDLDSHSPAASSESIEDLKYQEDEDEWQQGNFKHLKRKKRTFFYEDVRNPPDEFFNFEVGTSCDTYFRGKPIMFKPKEPDTYFHIIDLDHYDYHKVVFEIYLNKVLQSIPFRLVILSLVITSSVLTGIATFPKIQDEHSEIFKTVDQVILSVFIFEILIKWMYDFRLFWTGFWNYMDFVVVMMIILTSVFPFTGGSASLNVIRVVRAFRSLKSLSSLSSLTIVYNTVVKSGKDLLNILGVLLLFMAILSIMGVILFDLRELNDMDEPKFLNALDAWYVLFVCITEDGWNDYVTLYRDTYYFPHISVYLIVAVSIGAFAFANLIVAVIVANLENSVTDLNNYRISQDDPLDTKHGFITDKLTIESCYDIFAKQPLNLRRQRPMFMPNLKNLSTRRVEVYLQTIVALEHCMIESEIIHEDFQRIMAVLLTIALQLDIYSETATERERELGREYLEEFRRFSIHPNEKPMDAVERMEREALLNKLRQSQLAPDPRD